MAEKFISQFSTPHLMMVLAKKSVKQEISFEGNDIIFEGSDYNLTLKLSGVNPEPAIKVNSSKSAFVLGSPILDGKIACEQVLERVILDECIDKDFVKSINGEFLIVCFDKKKDTIQVANDRFTSIPLFYMHDQVGNSFCASPYFSDIWDFLKKSDRLKINKEAFFEFLWFQRLFGSKTYAEDCHFLPDASLLSIKDGKVDIQKYWQRDYTKTHDSLKEVSHSMADLVRSSVLNKTSDGVRYGHFLSGGMDSRTVLGAFPDDRLPSCYTATLSMNRECRTAQQIAQTKGAKHTFLELDPEHYAKIFEHSVRVIGGMYNYDHGLFYGYNDVVTKDVDVSFHGHGFDYMFQGMYIPAKSVVIGGRTLYLKSMIDIPDDLVSYFINNASYRIKLANIWKYINDNKKSSLEEFQRNSISEILEAGKQLTENKNDLWEYLTFHHISRHYSYPNHASIATYVEQRTISFDNDLFDFYLSLPVEHRFNGKIEKECLKILDSSLAKIWSANTNLPVTASPLKQTIYQFAGFVKRRIIPEKQKPTWQERTWPSREYAIRNQEKLVSAVKDLYESDILEQLEFLDLNKIRKDFPLWLKGEDVAGMSGDLVQTLITIGTFLKQ